MLPNPNSPYAVWPATLPGILYAAQPIAPSNTGRRIEMESGRARQIRVVTGRSLRFNVAWKFDEAEWQTFCTFVHSTIHNGADFFQLDMRTGEGMKAYDVRMVEGKYTVSYQEPFYVVSTTVERLDTKSATKEQWEEALLLAQMENAIRIQNIFHWIINTDMPLNNKW